MNFGSFRLSSLYWKIFLVIVSSCLPYIMVVSAPFLHDDNPAILKNPDVQVSQICVEKASSKLLAFFFIAPFSVRVVGVAARHYAATLHSLPTHPSFRLGEVPSDSIQDPLCNWSI